MWYLAWVKVSWVKADGSIAIDKWSQAFFPPRQMLVVRVFIQVTSVANLACLRGLWGGERKPLSLLIFLLMFSGNKCIFSGNGYTGSVGLMAQLITLWLFPNACFVFRQLSSFSAQIGDWFCPYSILWLDFFIYFWFLASLGMRILLTHIGQTQHFCICAQHCKSTWAVCSQRYTEVRFWRNHSFRLLSRKPAILWNDLAEVAIENSKCLQTPVWICNIL